MLYNFAYITRLYVCTYLHISTSTDKLVFIMHIGYQDCTYHGFIIVKEHQNAGPLPRNEWTECAQDFTK